MPYTKTASRRAFLRAAVLALAACTGLTLRPRLAQAESNATSIGWSQWGQPLMVYRFGDGPVRLFLLGGQHGGPEANTVELTHKLMEYLTLHPNVIPPNVTVYAMPEGNPDGLFTGSRQYVSGVDPNRNWASPDWQPDAYDSNGRYIYGLGGPSPFSERETEALGHWMWSVWPHYTVNYHSAGGFMFGSGDGLSGELSRLYAEVSGYPLSGGGAPGGGGSRLGYRATGNMNGWARSVGMGGCLIELSNAYDPEFERNLDAVLASLGRLGKEQG